MSERITCPQCRVVVAKPATEQEEAHFCPSCLMPQVIVAGKYLLERHLSEGGCGVLYLARHQRLSLEPMRVIKFIHPDLLNKEVADKRFAREVEITSAISQKNEHIVRVYDDFGRIEKLGHYFVMEYLEGLDLAQLIVTKGLPSLEVIFHIFRQLCDAIKEAHRANVIHRDLKPDNIFLIHRGNDPHFVKVIDFGIAKSTENEARTALTKGVIGTPEYMAPEQCSGKPIDARTDIYAMGIILYELLVGHTPFLPPEMQAKSSVVYLAFAQMTQEVPPPSQVRPEQNFPPQLEKLILKCLEKNPEDRYQNLEELSQALREAEEATTKPLPSHQADIQRQTPLPTNDATDFEIQGISFEDFPHEQISGQLLTPLPTNDVTDFEMQGVSLGQRYSQPMNDTTEFNAQTVSLSQLSSSLKPIQVEQVQKPLPPPPIDESSSVLMKHERHAETIEPSTDEGFSAIFFKKRIVLGLFVSILSSLIVLALWIGFRDLQAPKQQSVNRQLQKQSSHQTLQVALQKDSTEELRPKDEDGQVKEETLKFRQEPLKRKVTKKPSSKRPRRWKKRHKRKNSKKKKKVVLVHSAPQRLEKRKKPPPRIEKKPRTQGCPEDPVGSKWILLKIYPKRARIDSVGKKFRSFKGICFLHQGRSIEITLTLQGYKECVFHLKGKKRLQRAKLKKSADNLEEIGGSLKYCYR